MRIRSATAVLLVLCSAAPQAQMYVCNVYHLGKKPSEPASSPGSLRSIGALAEHNGDLYGTSPVGGEESGTPGVVGAVPDPALPPKPLGLGTIFKLTPAGKLVVLHAFDGKPTGSTPMSGLTLAPDGFLYGTTSGGGKWGGGTLSVSRPETRRTVQR